MMGSGHILYAQTRSAAVIIATLIAAFLLPPDMAGATSSMCVTEEPDSPPVSGAISAGEEPQRQEIPVIMQGREFLEISEEETPEGELDIEADEEKTIVVSPDSPYGLDGKKIFNPDPTRAVWLSALFPGLGQIYNRRYWKLPIVVGGFMGLIYATNWNNNQYSDYSQGFRDITDSDPATKSYMNFFPPTTNESDLDMGWLTSVMRSRKNYYRRNRDLCIICMVGLYFICMIDAYVDASMAHFDISPDLSLDMTPAVMVTPGDRRLSLGLNWALTF